MISRRRALENTTVLTTSNAFLPLGAPLLPILEQTTLTGRSCCVFPKHNIQDALYLNSEGARAEESFALLPKPGSSRALRGDRAVTEGGDTC